MIELLSSLGWLATTGLFLCVSAYGLMLRTGNLLPDKTPEAATEVARSGTARPQDPPSGIRESRPYVRLNRLIFVAGWCVFVLGSALVTVGWLLP